MDVNISNSHLHVMQNYLLVSVLHVCVGNELIENWIISSDVHQLLWQTVDDGEGYVRASVVSALNSLHASDKLWCDFTHKHVSEACQKALVFLRYDIR